MSRLKIVLPLLALISLLPAASGCARGEDFNSQVDAITAPYSFSIFNWEIKALGGMFSGIFDKGASENTDAILTYFGNIERMQGLKTQIDGAIIGGGMASAETELDSLEGTNSGLSSAVVDGLKVEIKSALKQAGIDNPFNLIGTSFIFPPIEAVLASPPNLLVISPRDRIETVKQVTLLPEMSREEMENIEAAVENLGYAALVVPIGGMATYPSYVTNDGGLRFTIDSIVHEWLHQYLAFTPLGFRYILDRAGIRPDYDIATMNETVVSMVAKEIGAEVYAKYAAGNATDNATVPPASGIRFQQGDAGDQAGRRPVPRGGRDRPGRAVHGAAAPVPGRQRLLYQEAQPGLFRLLRRPTPIVPPRSARSGRTSRRCGARALPSRTSWRPSRR